MIKNFRKFNNIKESNQNKIKVLFVTGGDDYHALSFENKYGGTNVSDILDNIDNYKSDKWDLKVYEFDGPIDSNFVKFIKDTVMDYDQSKNENFYVEGDVI